MAIANLVEAFTSSDALFVLVKQMIQNVTLARFAGMHDRVLKYKFLGKYCSNFGCGLYFYTIV